MNFGLDLKKDVKSTPADKEVYRELSKEEKLMETYRRQYTAELRVILKGVEKAQERDNEAIFNITRSNYSADFVNKKKEELEANMEKRKKDIEMMARREKDLISGRLDDEIKNDLKKHTATRKTNEEDLEKKKKDLSLENETKKTKMNIKYKEQNLERQQERDYRYFYKQFNKIGDSLPDYIKSNLAEMPSNKGYIWRGCWFFGECPEEYNQPLIMFEKNKGILNIHEYYPLEYRLYEKRGKDRKQLIMTQAKVPKKWTKSFTGRSN